ncbi:hypothetical protein EJ06DRAFT_550380 [Trichodelitschia bisporula]|uniref:Clr5 domain-containing protein n=1 Tax=Trichodelitschia bisporula TaxID=703511 RepID=A0A6G1HR20_9PEZI|nr:hypothetical protein EJ06DRAFT_550380 [Trichodelitschia bisporula]
MLFKFLSTSQPRAPRIKKEEWEKHKEDIVREYTENDLAYMVEWMARNRNFTASAKQFEHQLNRWKVRKYRKGAVNGQSLSGASTSCDANRPSPNALQSVASTPSSATNTADGQQSTPARSDPRSSVTADTALSGTEVIAEPDTAAHPTEMEAPQGSYDASSHNTSTPVVMQVTHIPVPGIPNVISHSVWSFEEERPAPQPPVESQEINVPVHDPTLAPSRMSPSTRSFISLAGRLSRLKRPKPTPSMDSMTPGNDQMDRKRARLSRASSSSSLSSAMSSLRLGSRLSMSSRRTFTIPAESNVADKDVSMRTFGARGSMDFPPTPPLLPDFAHWPEDDGLVYTVEGADEEFSSVRIRAVQRSTTTFSVRQLQLPVVDVRLPPISELPLRESPLRELPLH